MKRLVYLLFTVILFTNCSHRIVRTGYKVKKSDHVMCDVAIKKYYLIPDTLPIVQVGEIKLGESGFSVTCSEEHAIEILRGEACAVNANLIVITKENRPNLGSSCYRCEAAFYRYAGESSAFLKSDDEYNSTNVGQRVNRDRTRNTVYAIGSAIAGFLIGYLLFL